jgi:hypothetical protein
MLPCMLMICEIFEKLFSYEEFINPENEMLLRVIITYYSMLIDIAIESSLSNYQEKENAGQ